MSVFRSLSGKKWQKAPEVSSAKELCDLLLKERNLSHPNEIQKFLTPSLKDLIDPKKMQGMEKAVERIQQALKKKERIMVYGDFDTDGITSTVILVQGLKELGAEVSYRIPDRNTDSHGLKTSLIHDIAQTQTSLIITCDCGINDIEEMRYASSQNIDLIITDHHQPKENILDREKYTCALLNPLYNGCQYPEKNLSGSGVAFKLIQALSLKMNFPEKQKKEDWILKFAEISAVGLIADCVPLTGESRVIAKLGLEKMKTTSWEGLKKLFEKTKTHPACIDEQTIGFFIAPRLNAASRIGNVKKALQLFLGTPEKYDFYIDQLEVYNETRKELTHKSYQESRIQIREGAPFQILQKNDWEMGILGLIASRHCEDLLVPIIACSIREDGKMGGSCRAPKGFSIIKALEKHSELFEHFGGHDGAAGFITDPKHFPKIQEALDQYFLHQKADQTRFPCTTFLPASLLNFEIVDFLRSLSPFGIGNPEPLFGISKAQIIDVEPVGKLKNHMKLLLSYENQIFPGIAFFAENFLPHLEKGDQIDGLFSLSDSYWNEERRLEIRIKDIRKIEN